MASQSQPLVRGYMAATPVAEPSCLYCGETDISPNVECWEMYDALICDECADQAHDDNSQFGVGA